MGPDQCHVNVHVNEFEVSDFLLSFSVMSFSFIQPVKTLGQIQGLSVSLPHSVSIQQNKVTLNYVSMWLKKISFCEFEPLKAKRHRLKT